MLMLMLVLGLSAAASSADATWAVAVGEPVGAGAWTVAQAPGHGVVTGFLDGVDCLTAASCLAVGNETTNGLARGLVETLSGDAWTAAQLRLAAGSTAEFLFSISCPTAGGCVAVGYSYARQSGHPLIERQSGSSWTPTLPVVANSLGGFLYGVSCPTPGACVAVGNTYTGLSQPGTPAVTEPLIETLRGGRWTLTRSPSLGADGGNLNAVTCSSPHACVAVGYQQTTKTDGRTVVETLSHGTWSLTLGAKVARYTATSGLTAVSCSRPSVCAAVGQVPGGIPIIEAETNAKWSTVPSSVPNPNDRASGLAGVSCPSTSHCLAVGEQAKTMPESAYAGAFGTPLGALIETGTVKNWSPVIAPPQLPPESGFHAVSCAERACVAVGQSGDAYGPSTPPTDTARTLIIQTQ